MCRWVACGGSLLAFVALFDPWHPQRLIDSLWLLALALWWADIRRRTSGHVLAAYPQPQDLLLIGALLVIFVVLWLPFYDNWRWAYTPDSLIWYTFARQVARGAFSRNLLSVHGVDDNFTYLHSLAFNGLLFLFKPSLFWHRVGKLIVSCLSLAAIYAYFALTLGRWWAAAVVVCTAVNYVWLWFSYISYGHIDSFIFTYLTLALATLIWRDPERLGQWGLCGLVGGIALFFTQTSWSAVAASGLVLVVFGLATRRFAAVRAYALSFVLAATPILLQLPDLLKMAVRQTRSQYDWDYMRAILTDLVRLPYAWNYCRIGIQGAFLRWPLGPLYLLGLALAALSLLPPARRALRVPPVARVLLALWAWDMVLLTLTNNANPQPSSKRVYNLIPAQVFFGLLPLYTLWAGTRRHRVLRGAAVALTTALIAIYAITNMRLLVKPRPLIYGYNVFDAMIELRQRFPQRPAVMFSSRREVHAVLYDPNAVVATDYHVADTVTVNPVLTPAALHAACAAHRIVCYEPNFDGSDFRNMVRGSEVCLHPLTLLNSVEALCFDCEPAPCPAPPTDAELGQLIPTRTVYQSACD